MRSAAERSPAPSEPQPPPGPGSAAAAGTCRRLWPPFFLPESAGREPGPAAGEQAGGRASERRREAAGARPSRAPVPVPAAPAAAAAAASRTAACVTPGPPEPAPRRGPALPGLARAPRPQPAPAGPAPPPTSLAARPRPKPRPPRAWVFSWRNSPPQHAPPPAATSAPAPGWRLRAPGSGGTPGPASLEARRRLGREVASVSPPRAEARPVRISWCPRAVHLRDPLLGAGRGGELSRDISSLQCDSREESAALGPLRDRVPYPLLEGTETPVQPPRA